MVEAMKWTTSGLASYSSTFNNKKATNVRFLSKRSEPCSTLVRRHMLAIKEVMLLLERVCDLSNYFNCVNNRMVVVSVAHFGQARSVQQHLLFLSAIAFLSHMHTRMFACSRVCSEQTLQDQRIVAPSLLWMGCCHIWNSMLYRKKKRLLRHTCHENAHVRNSIASPVHLTLPSWSHPSFGLGQQ